MLALGRTVEGLGGGADRVLTAVTVARTSYSNGSEALAALESSLLVSFVVFASEQVSANRSLVHKGLNTLFFITYSIVITHFK